MLSCLCDDKLMFKYFLCFIFFTKNAITIITTNLSQQSLEDLFGYSVLNHVNLTFPIPTSDAVFKNKKIEFV